MGLAASARVPLVLEYPYCRQMIPKTHPKGDRGILENVRHNSRMTWRSVMMRCGAGAAVRPYIWGEKGTAAMHVGGAGGNGGNGQAKGAQPGVLRPCATSTPPPPPGTGITGSERNGSESQAVLGAKLTPF